MKAYVDKLSADLTEQYRLYIETFMVDLWSDHGVIDFRVGFALRSDHKLRSTAFKIEATEAINDIKRCAVITALFAEITALPASATATPSASASRSSADRVLWRRGPLR